jgi:hypothetical protein
MMPEGSKVLLVGPRVPSNFTAAFKTVNRDELNSPQLLQETVCIHVKCVFDVPPTLWGKFDVIFGLADTQRSHRLKLQELFPHDVSSSPLFLLKSKM